jgi:hypothetical protein
MPAAVELGELAFAREHLGQRRGVEGLGHDRGVVALDGPGITHQHHASPGRARLQLRNDARVRADGRVGHQYQRRHLTQPRGGAIGVDFPASGLSRTFERGTKGAGCFRVGRQDQNTHRGQNLSAS